MFEALRSGRLQRASALPESTESPEKASSMITEREDEEAVALIPFHYSQEQERVDDDEDGKGNQDEEAQQEIQHEPSIPKTRVGSFKLLLLLFVTMTPAAAGLFLFLSLAKNQDSPTRLIFTFGDSYTATEFSLSREPPSQSNPLGNPEFPGHTTSGGPNWLGWLLQESPENTLSYNFAIKGRTFHDFPSQASTFLSMASRSSKHYVPWRGINKHIFVVWFGVNDMNSFFTSPSYDVVNRRLEQCFNVVDRLRNAGAENFLFLGIPPMWRLPMHQGVFKEQTTPKLRKMCDRWNEVMQSRITEFEQDNLGWKGSFLDTQPAFNEVLDHADQYRAPDNVCSKKSNETCLWTDSIHPSQALQKSVSRAVRRHLQSTGFLPP